MIDGVPTFSFKTPSAEAGMVNTALYDRVEVIRGAAGLLNGVGEPGGSVNLARKRPTSEFAGHVTGGVGRWNSYNAESSGCPHGGRHLHRLQEAVRRCFLRDP
ncbi:hypothetical protein G6F50_017509 [Rhizopus delemar]|uniref:TonB-dependent receptor plug domain-containing protein n=1 Tax=Rhizopus delemar TaxID=936053 RepID=A0A9P6XPS1_9FUNG|nr:hypothetical protein G6F50_017509 [Rhizopus delemar]